MAKEAMTEIDDEGLVQRLAEAKQELFNLRFQHVTGQLPSATRLRETRKTIARIHTELRAREITAADELAASKES
jgi:large subunit ribosomal protein L29